MDGFFARPSTFAVSCGVRPIAVVEGLRDGSIETGVDPISGNLLSEMATEEPTATEAASS